MAVSCLTRPSAWSNNNRKKNNNINNNLDFVTGEYVYKYVHYITHGYLEQHQFEDKLQSKV